MNPAEVIVHEVDRYGMGLILDLFAEGIGQSGHPAHAHPHREILPFYKTCRNLSHIRIALDSHLARPTAISRAIACRALIWRCIIDFVQHGEIHIVPERMFNGCQIGPVSIRRELYSMGQA